MEEAIQTTGLRIELANRVMRGAGLLFWTALVSSLLIAVSAIAIPFIGGKRGDLKWVALIPAGAGFLLLIAVFRVSTPELPTAQIGLNRRLRQALRAWAVLEVFARCGGAVCRHMTDVFDTSYLWVAESGVHGVAILLLFAYLMVLAKCFEQTRLARSLGMMAWIGSGLVGLRFLDTEDICNHFGASYSLYLFVVYARMAVDLIVWIWALRLLWKFRQTLARWAKGRCLSCGYLLKRLTESRCPECGTEFQGWPILREAGPVDDLP